MSLRKLFPAFRTVLLFLGFSCFQAFAVSPAPGLSDEHCAHYLNEVMKDLDLDGDLALVPYVRKILSDVYAMLNVSGLSDAELVENIVKADLRGLSFQLEVMGQALKSADKIRFKQLQKWGRTLENAIGDYTFETELLEYVKTNPETSKFLTPRIEAMFEGRVIATRDRLIQNLRREGWTEGGDAYREIFKLIEKAERVDKKSKLKKTLLNWMADELEEIHAMILEGRLDPKNIEWGIHKLRRLLRKIAISILSYDGMYFLDESLKMKGITLSENALKNPFVPDETNLQKHAVGISKVGYLFIGDLISGLGKLKSGNGMKEYAFNAVNAANSKLGTEANPLLAVLDPKGVSRSSFEKTVAEGEAFFRTIIKTEVLLQMAKQNRKAAKKFD